MADFKTAIEFIWALPGKQASSFRRTCAEYLCRMLGGDASLIDEIEHNAEGVSDETRAIILNDVPMPIVEAAPLVVDERECTSSIVVCESACRKRSICDIIGEDFTVDIVKRRAMLGICSDEMGNEERHEDNLQRKHERTIEKRRITIDEKDKRITREIEDKRITREIEEKCITREMVEKCTLREIEDKRELREIEDKRELRDAEERCVIREFERETNKERSALEHKRMDYEIEKTRLGAKQADAEREERTFDQKAHDRTIAKECTNKEKRKLVEASIAESRLEIEVESRIDARMKQKEIEVARKELDIANELKRQSFRSFLTSSCMVKFDKTKSIDFSVFVCCFKLWWMKFHASEGNFVVEQDDPNFTSVLGEHHCLVNDHARGATIQGCHASSLPTGQYNKLEKDMFHRIVGGNSLLQVAESY